MTVDPLWPKLRSFQYANSIPTSVSDPTGLNPACIGAGIGLAGIGIAALACLGAPGGFLCCFAAAVASSPLLKVLLTAMLVAAAICLLALLVSLGISLATIIRWLSGLGAAGAPGLASASTYDLCEADYLACQATYRKKYCKFDQICHHCLGRCQAACGQWPMDEACNYSAW